MSLKKNWHGDQQGSREINWNENGRCSERQPLKCHGENRMLGMQNLKYLGADR